jgi:hypothetical protein
MPPIANNALFRQKSVFLATAYTFPPKAQKKIKNFNIFSIFPLTLLDHLLSCYEKKSRLGEEGEQASWLPHVNFFSPNPKSSLLTPNTHSRPVMGRE